MRTAQELMDRWKNAVKNVALEQLADSGKEVIQGMRYQDSYGRMVTVTAVGPSRVTYRREGYGKPCEVNRTAFERDFKKVQS